MCTFAQTIIISNNDNFIVIMLLSYCEYTHLNVNYCLDLTQECFIYAIAYKSKIRKSSLELLLL